MSGEKKIYCGAEADFDSAEVDLEAHNCNMIVGIEVIKATELAVTVSLLAK